MFFPTIARRFRGSWLVVSWLTAFLVGTDLFIIAPLIPEIAKALRVSPSSLTVLVSLFSLTYAIASPLVGRYAQRHGVARQLRLGIVILGVANIYTALAPNLPQLVCSRVAAGFGAASITPLLYALAAEHAVPAQRGRSLAVVSSGLVLALAGGAPLGLLLGNISDWRWVFGGLGLVLLLLWPWHLRVWCDAGDLSQKPMARESAQRLKNERLRDATPLFLGMAVWAASVYGSYTLIGTALEDGLHWSVPAIAVVLASFGGGATVGSLSGGRLVDRFGATTVIRWNFLLAAGAFVIAAGGVATQRRDFVAVALFGVALFAYGIFPALQAHAAERFLRLRPMVLGLMSSALYVGISMGASIGAEIYQNHGMVLVLLSSALVALGGHALGWQMQVRHRSCRLSMARSAGR